MTSKLVLRLQILLGLIFFFLLTIVLLIRFTDGTIKVGGKILIGYDEKKERFQIWEKPVYHFDGIDGPHLINDTLYYVRENETLQKERFNGNQIKVLFGSESVDHFLVPIRGAHPIPIASVKMPSKLIAVSDIEGNFEALSTFLQANGVINDQFSWIFGDGHLVLNGDFVDRGEEVLPSLWLIYKLEQEAVSQGGKVHFILGNHEVMNIQGDFRYAHGKYRKLAQEISPAKEQKERYKLLFSEQSELGRWLRSKNIATQIGPYLFVHAGVSPRMLNVNLSLEDINHLARKHLDTASSKDTLVQLIMGREGPFWYRGLVRSTDDYDKISESELAQLLEKFQIESIVIGHSIVADVSSDFDGKVIRLDVKHGKEAFSQKTKGLLLQGTQQIKLDGTGAQEPLKPLD